MEVIIKKAMDGDSDAFAGTEYDQNTGIQDKEIEKCEWKQLLLCLDESSRIIVQLYYYEEFTVKEIAEILGMNRNTVMTKLDRARKKLRKEIV